MKRFILLVCLMFGGESFAESQLTIAFGSCAKQDKEQPVWDQIASYDPNMFLFIGDNVYADSDEPEIIEQAYADLQNIPPFSRFREHYPILAVWDDHDYGRNDAGMEFEIKEESQRIFQKFWDNGDLEVGQEGREGVYHYVVKTYNDIKVQFIMLDTRYHRSELAKEGDRYVSNTDPDATILGEEQWRWLERVIMVPADVRIVASSIQFLSDRHPYEKWSNFPVEKERMLKLIEEHKTNVIFVSGDRHHGEISRIMLPGLSSPLYDFTSSGLTNTEAPSKHRDELNPYRLDESDLYNQRNFGLIEIRRAKDKIQFELKLIDAKDKVLVRAHGHF